MSSTPERRSGRAARRTQPVVADRGGWGLSDLMSNTLEPAYREVAARRPPGQRPGWRTTALLIAGVAVAGLLVAVAYRDTSRAMPDRARARVALIEQIEHSRDRVGALREAAAGLRAEVTELQQSVLGASAEGQALLAEVATLEVAAAAQPVTGPGIVLTIGNPGPETGGDPVGGTPQTSSEALITDRDLARAVNALWQVGAEAIAIDGHRIGPVTPIRQAGGAILVDFLPVSSPYVIEAIGPVSSMGADFATTVIGRRFATYRSAYDATFSIDNATSLTLDAGTAVSVTYATATS